jgi:hypothetical protein
MGDAFDLAAFDFFPAAVEGGFEFVGDCLRGVGGVEEAVLKTLDDFHPVLLGKLKEGVDEGFSSRGHGEEAGFSIQLGIANREWWR